MSDRLTLGLDTSAAHCAAALFCGSHIIAAGSEAMARGQAERLVPLLEELLAQGGVSWEALERIGVGIGPGNFTGLRIAVAAARGLALALEIPAIGVSTFQAISLGAAGPHIPAVRGPGDHVYIRTEEGAELMLPLAEATALKAPLCYPPAPSELACRIARIAAKSTLGVAPAPLYLRAADAAPARDLPPVMLPGTAAG